MAKTEGQIIPRGKDKWLVRVFLRRDENGRKKYISKIAHGGKKAAEKVLRELVTKKKAHKLVEPSKMTVGNLVERWLRDVVKPTTRASTLQSYTNALNANILPTLKDVPLAKLTNLELQCLISSLDGDGKSRRTIQYAIGLTRSALKKAVQWRALDFNPADDLDLPPKKKRKLVVPTDEELNRLFSALRDDMLWPLWALMITTGMRPGECLVSTPVAFWTESPVWI